MNNYFFITECIEDGSYLFEHTLIVCSFEEDVDLIVKFLNANNIANIGCNEKSNISQVKFVNDWNFRKGCGLEIIVCTDNVLPELKLNNVKRLIHYSLSSTWTKFTIRFATLFNSFLNRQCKEEVRITFFSKPFFM